MKFYEKYFVEVKHGSKVTYSESDLNKLDRMYETELFERKEKRIMSPFRREMQRSFQSQVRDYAFERILDRHLYTFKYMLVIPDPYGVSKQTALILFNSSKRCKVHYRVAGNTKEADFEADTIFTTRHRVPVMGLYQGRNNKVDMELIDESGQIIKHRVLTIYVSPISEVQTSIVKKTDNNLSQFPFILLNGIFYNPIAIDTNGDVRFSLQCQTDKLGIIPMQNGRFLLADKTAGRVDEHGNIKPCRYQEIDYMGRVYRTFLLDHSIGRALAQNGDSLFMVASSAEGYDMDTIIELDMNTGKVIQSCNLADILSDKYRDKNNWANITHMEYYDGLLLAVVKRLHSVIMLNWKKRTVEWVLAPEKPWEDTFVKNYLLKNEEESAEAICSKPEYAALTGKISEDKYRMILFDTMTVGDVPNGVKGKKKALTKIVEIDIKKKSYRVVQSFTSEKSLRYGSAFSSEDEQSLLIMSGFLKDTANCNAYLEEVSFKDGTCYKKTQLTKAYSGVWEFLPDVKDYCVSMEKNENVVVGKLKAPEEFHGTLSEISSERIDRYYFGRARICDDLFLFAMLPGGITNMYFIGENHAYVQNYSNVKPEEKRRFFAVPLDEFGKDEYNVYVECEGIIYKLKNDIRVVK